MNRDMSRRQRLSMIVAAATVPVIMTCAGRSWQWVLAGCGAAAAFYGLLYIMLRETQTTGGLCPAVLEGLGPWLGGAVLILSAAWTLYAAASTAARSVAAFPDGEADRLATLCLLALTAACGYHGSLCAARCAGVLAPVLAGLYGVILLAAVPDVKLEWCRPTGGWTQSAGVLAAMLFPSAALYLKRESARRERAPGWVLAALMLIPAAVAAITAGVLSPELVANEPFAFYTLTKSLNLLSVMERFEPILSASLYLGFFCIASLLISSCAEQLRAALPWVKTKWLTPGLCAAAFGLTFAENTIPEVLRQAGAAIFWGVTPVFVLLMVAIKKVAKKAKKGVDK